MLEDSMLINQIITCSTTLQLDLLKWKTENTDHTHNNPQTIWETFKLDITSLTKSHTKSSTHKMNTKAKNLDKDKRSITTTGDFEINGTH
jgi:hypothetical protein